MQLLAGVPDARRPVVRFRPLATLRVALAELAAGRPISATAELVVGLLGPATCRLLNRHGLGCRGTTRCARRPGARVVATWL